MLPHVRKVLSGEYDIPGYDVTRPVILDIGANVGSFAIWAMKRWPGCHVHCYEPLPDNFTLLKSNLGQLEGSSVTLNNFAVGNPELRRMRLGLNNCGEASFYDIGEQGTATIDVETKPPSVLPKARILKMDTEGSEIDILERMPSLEFEVVVLEYHSETNRRRADELLREFMLVGGEIRCLHRGTLKYVNRRLVPPDANT
jgi:FkbM family methyltransferase